MESWEDATNKAINEYLKTPPTTNQCAIEFSSWLNIREKLNISNELTHDDLLSTLNRLQPKSQLEALCQQQIQSLMNYIDCEDENGKQSNSCLNKYLKCLVETSKIITRSVDEQGKQQFKQALAAIQATLD